ncbi:MAG TPA: hypothetical protein VFA58_04525 [Chthoniobacterales bacterium]|nr:hypothetical protein [Chthoniobacterales bacterium]
MLLRVGSFFLLCVFISLGQSAFAALTVDVTSPTTSWTPITYSNNNYPDPSDDQQTGSGEGDIVGNQSHPSVYVAFGDAGTPSLTDGVLGLRIRLGADDNPAGFKGALFVGIDANADGALDLFIGVDNSGSNATIGIWNPGPGSNTSPNTTSIVSAPLVSYTLTALNYSWTAVNTTIDPSVGTGTDLNNDGKNDYFLTFTVQFADIVAQLAAKGISVNENSSFAYVVATATQANALNQDLNGVGKNYDGNATWSSLGIIANPITAAGIEVPEPSAGLVAAMIAALAIAHATFRASAKRSAAP